MGPDPRMLLPTRHLLTPAVALVLHNTPQSLSLPTMQTGAAHIHHLPPRLHLLGLILHGMPTPLVYLAATQTMAIENTKKHPQIPYDPNYLPN